ncbi:MAG: RNA polymerase sporulation sigma factor SigH [Clostridia bacterium]|nr:RNA polymerase sporulation sigma factor SigH [Clostridia bacterium]
MTEIRDEHLAASAQTGDAAAMEQLCDRYKDRVRMIARPYFLIGADRDDVIQEGMIGLYKAIRDYRPDCSTAFSSFAEMCVTRQIISAINASRRQKHLPLNSYISLYNTSPGDDRELIELLQLSDDGPEDAFISKETSETLRRQVKSRLTPLERRVTELFLEGLTYQQIAEAIDRPPKSVDNALSRVKKKLGSVLE